MEDVVAQYETDGVFADEAFTDEQSVSDAACDFLNFIGDVDAPVRTVAEQTVEGAFLSGRDDDEDVANTGLHEHGKRIVDHGLVVDGQERLASRARHGVES